MRTVRHPLTFTALLLFFFAAIPLAAQTLTTVASFNFTDGANPGTIVQGSDGNFYGVTEGGGNGNPGVIFKVSPTGAITTLYTLTITSGLPAEPPAALLQANDGNFYGTMAAAGANDEGTIFKMTPTGTITVLHNFTGAEGSAPVGQLVQATDGSLYGTTAGGGANSECVGGCGTVFKITPAGTLTTLYSFCSQPNCADGALPVGGLILGADGNFYGSTLGGGTNYSTPCIRNIPGCGTVFQITPTGTPTTLYRFCSQSNCPDGASPLSGVVQGVDGNFYGTTWLGGTNCVDGPNGSCGTVFKLRPEGILTTLYSFCSLPNCLDGGGLYAGLVQATDGNFYGTTAWGGTVNNLCYLNPYSTCGTIFRITPDGAFAVLHAFDFGDGANVQNGLVQATDGKIYGSTLDGGAYCVPGYDSCGTVFSLDMGLAPFVVLQPTSGQVGSTVTILGANLSGATSVTFNGTRAPILTNTGSTITTTVPAGATTGTVQVTFSDRTLKSNTDFQVVGPIQFVPVTPCRLLDTRQTHDPIPGGTSYSYVIPQLGGCGIPASAAAYSLNVTVSPHGPLGYLTIWPNRETQPFVSTMNSPDGRIKANAAIVPAGNNAVSVYASDTTDVILDINGYFTTPGADTLQFYTLPPCRIVDTRNNMHGGTLHAGAERDYTIPTNCGVPRSAQAYSFNITVIPPHGGLDYLTVWPKGETMPVVSTLNDDTGTIVANAAIVPAGPNNATAFYPHSNRTDLLIDVNGYFAPPGTGGLSLYPVAPCRVLDTRNVGRGQPFQGVYNSPNGVDVLTSPCAPPSTAKAFVFNATVVPPGPMLYLTLWPHDQNQPTVSTLNAADGAITSNMAIVPTNDGSIDAYAYALTQLILDISGYFAP